MKRKYITMGLTCGFLLITGICYSCAYNSKPAVLVPQKDNSGTEAAAVITGEPANDSAAAEAPGIKEQPVTQKHLIYAHICGAVVKPGVYQAEEGARLIDFIELSGGLAREAAGDYINQAELVTDGQRIYIPTVKEVEDLPPLGYTEGPGNSPDNGAASALVNINTADEEELMRLPGIGEAKAGSIIEYRNQNGKFKTIEELMNISGIKEGLFNRISSKITVN